MSPRAGFTVFLGESQYGPPPLTLRGGFGEFRGTAPAQLFASALNATGLNNGQSLLTCVGASAPTPDWAAYLTDPSSIPTSCNGGTPIFANQRRNVTVFDPDFQAPRAWRASLGLNRRFWDRYSFSIDAGYARGVAQSGSTDINLDTVPKFTLANESNRPVYVPPVAIVPTSGAVSVLSSRLHPEFGVVSQIQSNLSSDTKQVTFGLNGITSKGILFNASYTLTSSFDQSQGFSQGAVQGFGGTAGSTSGNPNISEWDATTTLGVMRCSGRSRIRSSRCWSSQPLRARRRAASSRPWLPATLMATDAATTAVHFRSGSCSGCGRHRGRERNDASARQYFVARSRLSLEPNG